MRILVRAGVLWVILVCAGCAVSNTQAPYAPPPPAGGGGNDAGGGGGGGMM